MEFIGELGVEHPTATERAEMIRKSACHHRVQNRLETRKVFFTLVAQGTSSITE